MSKSQPVRPGSPCTMFATNAPRITACHAGPGCCSAPCGQGAALVPFAVFLCTPGEAAVYRQCGAKHAPVRARKGRTIFRDPTRGSLSAEDRAALFHSFCRDACHPRFFAADSSLLVFRGGRFACAAGRFWRKPAARRLPTPERYGIGIFHTPTTLSTLFFA